MIFVPTTTLPLITTDFAACCSHVTDRVPDETAERLSRVLEALGEPTRVRRQSTIAATGSGEPESRSHAILGSVTVDAELLHCHGSDTSESVDEGVSRATNSRVMIKAGVTGRCLASAAVRALI